MYLKYIGYSNHEFLNKTYSLRTWEDQETGEVLYEYQDRILSVGKLNQLIALTIAIKQWSKF